MCATLYKKCIDMIWYSQYVKTNDKKFDQNFSTDIK